MVLAVTAAGLPFRDNISHVDLVIFFLLTVVVAAARLGRGPAVTAAVASVLSFDFFFVPPTFTLAVTNTEYLFTFAGLLVVGLVISALTAQLSEQVAIAEQRARQTQASFELSRDLAAEDDRSNLCQIAVEHVARTFSCQGAILLPSGLTLVLQSASPNCGLGPAEMEAATWSFQNNEPAGTGTNHFMDVCGFYAPLHAPQETVGVLLVTPAAPEETLQRRLFETFTNQIALALERVLLAEKARKAQLLRETEQLQSALLNSISHDLRTPLSSITGAISSLRDPQLSLDDHTRSEILENAWRETDRLNRLVGNLLDMTRLQSGAMRLARVPTDFQEIVEATLRELSDRLEGRQVVSNIPPDLPLLSLDVMLMVQVLSNLIDNSMKYSPPDSLIEICAYAVETEIVLEVQDRGIGIPDDEIDRVFDKFYRVKRRDGASGTGLGLAICKGIVEAHGGTIQLIKRPGGGLIARISLPMPEEN